MRMRKRLMAGIGMLALVGSSGKSGIAAEGQWVASFHSPKIESDARACKLFDTEAHCSAFCKRNFPAPLAQGGTFTSSSCTCLLTKQRHAWPWPPFCLVRY